jgi:hypothetical protein
MSDTSRVTCPHCGATLASVELPEAASFVQPYHLVCFNDDCPYYVRGWTWMSERYGVKSSYRYRVDPQSGHASPIAVWSPTALRSRMLGEDRPASAARKELS